MKNLFVLLLFLPIWLLACGGDEVQEPVDYEIDEATGLPLNPEPLPGGNFVVEGTINNMNLTPQSAPEFVVEVPSGQTYRIRSQGLDEITYEDGESIPVSGFNQGMRVRATVTQTAADQGSGGVGILVSNDLTVLR